MMACCSAENRCALYCCLLLNFFSGLLENCCIVLPGKRLLSRDVDGCLFQDQLLTVIQVCRRLQLGPGFSQKVFVKTLCKDVRVKVMFLHRPVCGIARKVDFVKFWGIGILLTYFWI